MRFQFTRKIRIFSISLLSLLLVYVALGFWLLPRVARSQIESFSREHWQREPTLGDVSFNPFTLALEIQGFDFRDSRSEPLLSFARLRVNLDVASLWRRGMSFHEIELDQPSGRVLVRSDGSLNLTELSAPFAAPPGAARPDEPPARLFIDRFQLRDGVVAFEDHARSTPFKARLTPVNFELRDFSTVGGSDNGYALQAESTAGEKFRWSGNFGLAPLSSRGEFELAEVRARTLWSYLQDSLGFEVADGVVGLHGSYEFAATEPDLTLRLSLANVDVGSLGIRPRGGDSDWISLTKVALADAKIDLARRTVDVARLSLGEGSIVARRDARGEVNLLALLNAPSEVRTPVPETEAVPEPEPEPWTVNVPELAVDGLRVEFTDDFVKPGARFTLTPVNLHLRGFSTAPGQPLNLDAHVALESGGTLAFEGEAVMSEDRFGGTITLQDLNLAALQPYVGTYTQMTLLSGVLTSELEAQYSPAAWRIAGRFDCAKVHGVDNALREDFVKWDRLALTGFELSAAKGKPGRLRIASIDARAPYLRLIIAPDQSTNVGTILARPADAPGPVQTVRGVSEPAGASQPLAIDIGKVRVENGSANFADFWITPNYAVSLQQLGGSISGLSSRKDSRARVALTGKIDRYAPAQIDGELNLLSASLFTDLRVKFNGVELTSVTPYSGRFAGYRIEKGKLSVDVRYLVENRKLDARQRFVVDQLTLGERVDSPDAVRLPLKLAVALLKDRNGVIDLGLPVTGSLDDPRFRLGPIIWKAFVNLLTGIATSPFKLIGGMFGGGEEVNLIDFEPGGADLDAAAREKLAALTKALHERPQLALDVPATYAPDADYAVLASRDLEARVASLARRGKEGRADVGDPAMRFEQLLALHDKERPGTGLSHAAQALSDVRARDREMTALQAANAELENLLRASVDTLEPGLQALAQQRARAIQDALLASGDVEPGRVFMLAPGAAPAAGGKPRISLSLK